MSAAEAFIRSIQLVDEPAAEPRSGHPWDLAVVRGLEAGVALHTRVTYFVGENGTGKSTLLEAIAVAAGLNPEGGSRNFVHSTRDSHSALGDALRLVRGARRPRTDFFLRAESLFTTATYLENLPLNPLAPYGGRSLHEQSHGESFLALMVHRFGAGGLYLLDEPEAALSAQNCLTFLRRVHELVEAGSQFVIATHSPITLAYPDATIYECTAEGLREVAYEDVDAVRLTRTFLDARERFVDRVLSEC